MLEDRKIEKDMIFYNPGKAGSVFTYKAGHFVNDHMIQDMVEHLAYDTESKVAWVEERRLAPRSA